VFASLVKRFGPAYEPLTPEPQNGTPSQQRVTSAFEARTRENLLRWPSGHISAIIIE
jgi:hypothetical protein